LSVQADVATVPPQPDPRCTVADPLQFSGLELRDGTNVSFPDRPIIACATAVTFAAFVRDLLAPSQRAATACQSKPWGKVRVWNAEPEITSWVLN
jgi:hypothetical protein